ncbi:hypothetical protein DPMN_189182 [Dreissena polymorpha]|uniref:Uncharacterized protein n=1 Tax=Dreissena polymorpha TaxID=45954 RepID=A0A9D4DV25_DREPO|nr:hypothetical protein DPMN_189182 [Dreissena polymorpha]
MDDAFTTIFRKKPCADAMVTVNIITLDQSVESMRTSLLCHQEQSLESVRDWARLYCS